MHLKWIFVLYPFKTLLTHICIWKSCQSKIIDLYYTGIHSEIIYQIFYFYSMRYILLTGQTHRINVIFEHMKEDNGCVCLSMKKVKKGRWKKREQNINIFQMKAINNKTNRNWTYLKTSLWNIIFDSARDGEWPDP